MATITRAGEPIELAGQFPSPGSAAPEFTLTGPDLAPLTLSDFDDTTLVLNIFPSIDTPTCATSVRTFNARLNELSNVRVLNVSADLPFAQARFCASEGLERVSNASSFRSPSFAEDYGVKMADGLLEGLLARAVVVIKGGQVVHSELVPEIKQEPNYDAALTAAQNA